MDEVILNVTGIEKNYGPTVALSGVDFTLRRGEVHGLIGENGSGKSTLSSVIAGICASDSGKMELHGAPYAPKSAVDAQNSGIAMIVQETGTVSSIGVAENIFLGNEQLFAKFGFVHRKAMREAAQQALAAIGADRISARIPAGAIDPESRKIVEIAKAMRSEPEVLIVDETTTALTQDGRELLYTCIKKMRDAGKGVILISHDLEEITSVCTMLTVLRDGAVIGTLTGKDFDADRIKAMMVGREISGRLYRNDYGGSCGDEVVLTAERLTGGRQVEDVSFELHRGEILGIGGLSSGGIHELGRLLFGMNKAVIGEVRLPDGAKVTNPNLAVRKGLGYVSKNRDDEAVMPNASIRNNAVLASLFKLARGGRPITKKNEKALASQVISEMEVKCASMEQPVRELSGGNKQKVSFGRWIGCGSKILILDCPTRGIDVGVKQNIYRLIYKLKTEGCSFVLISEELPELIGMSDRILILMNGRVTGDFKRSETLSEHDLIRVMV
jgi:ribose transport system ATP-binding protein